MIMWFIYIWLAAVTALIALLIYQSYADSNQAEQLISVMEHLTRSSQHQHDHLMKLESTVQDVKARFRPKKKKKENKKEIHENN